MKDKAPYALAGIWKEILDQETGELQDHISGDHPPVQRRDAELASYHCRGGIRPPTLIQVTPWTWCTLNPTKNIMT